MALRQWDHEVKAFPAERADDTLTEAVGLRTSWRCPEYSQSQVSNRFIELRRKNAIAIVDEKPVAVIRWDGFSKLL
jgi:hypothetical protein